MSHAKPPRRTPGPTTPADIITYRYNNELVYVPVAPNYIQALAHAREAFPKLKKLHDASLSLSLIAPGQGHKFVWISAPVWPTLINHMAQYQILDVHVALDSVLSIPIPDITITYADADDRGASTIKAEQGPPPYSGSDPSSQKVPCQRTRTLSASTPHPGRRSWFLQKLSTSSP